MRRARAEEFAMFHVERALQRPALGKVRRQLVAFVFELAARKLSFDPLRTEQLFERVV